MQQGKGDDVTQIGRAKVRRSDCDRASVQHSGTTDVSKPEDSSHSVNGKRNPQSLKTCQRVLTKLMDD